MVMPNFLGIGCKRAGSTLLHRALATNPAIYVPTARKELWYFGVNWHYGASWYERFFDEARPDQAVGEVSPGYIAAPDADTRVHSVLGPTTRLLVIVRHPAKQAWSWWLHDGAPGRFDGWLEEHTYKLSTGSHLQRWQKLFPHLHVLVLEEFVNAPEQHLQAMAAFLGVPNEWPGAAAMMSSPINSSGQRSRLDRFARRTAVAIRQAGFDRIVNRLKGHWRVTAAPAPLLPPEVHRMVHALFADDMARTEAVLGRRIESWQQ
jgi:hypothetical protein